MSLPLFLNPSPKPPEKPKQVAFVRRIVAQPIEPAKPVQTAIPTPTIRKFNQPPVIEPARIMVTQPPKPQPPPSKMDEIYTFCILAKILLSKDEVEKLNTIFTKLITNSTPVQIFSMKVSQIIDKIQILSLCWQAINERKQGSLAPQPELYIKTKALINVFLANNLSDSHIESHFNYMIYAINNSLPWVHVFSQIVRNQTGFLKPTALSRLVSYTRDVFRLVSFHKKPCCQTKISKLSFSQLIRLDEPANPFDLLKKHNDAIPVVKATKPYVPKPKLNIAMMKHFSPSYVPFKIKVNENENAMIFNHATKMFPVSVDIQGRYRPPPDHVLPVQYVDFFAVLEAMEVAENKAERVYAFSDNNPFISYCVGTAGRDAYGALWSEVAPHIALKPVRDIVVRRCRRNLGAIQNEHNEVARTAESVFITRSTNEFLQSIRLQNMPDSFEFPLVENEVSMYIEHIISTTASNKIPHLTFLNEVLSFIQMPNPIEFFHAEMFAGLLWLFSRLCDEVRTIFNASAVEMNTFDAVIDKVVFEVQENCQPKPESIFSMHRPLTEILKSTVQFKLVSDEMRQEAMKHYGNYAVHIAHFYPIVEKMNLICYFLHTDPHMKKLNSLMMSLGLFNKDCTDPEYINSRLGVYQASIKDIKLYKIIKIKLDREKGIVSLERN